MTEMTYFILLFVLAPAGKPDGARLPKHFGSGLGSKGPWCGFGSGCSLPLELACEDCARGCE